MPSPSYVPVLRAGGDQMFTSIAVTGTATITGATALNGGGTFGNTLAGTGALATTTMIGVQVTSDGFDRYRLRADGLQEWGPGNGARDTNLYRSAANQLKTDDLFIAALGLGVGNSAAATTLGAVTRRIQVFDAAGAALGFVPVYDNIT